MKLFALTFSPVSFASLGLYLAGAPDWAAASFLLAAGIYVAGSIFWVARC